jgi:hypothetical protein
MHRATIAQQRVRMEGWRTGAAWLKGRNSQGGREEQNILTRKKEKKQKSTLDSYRPSHGRASPLPLYRLNCTGPGKAVRRVLPTNHPEAIRISEIEI